MASQAFAFSSSSSAFSGVFNRNGGGQVGRRSLLSRWSSASAASGWASLSVCTACPNISSTFSGQTFQLPVFSWVSKRVFQKPRPVMMMAKPVMQFIRGVDEQTIPDVKLTKSRDGTNGVATFIFQQPSVFDADGQIQDITGFFMIDEEGMLQSVDVNAKFINGKPSGIEARYIMRSTPEWDRFMRFMERYSNENGLQFIKK